MNIGLAYKLRILIGAPKDLFYSTIWSYIPNPPAGPPPEYDVVEYDIRNGYTKCWVSNVYSVWDSSNLNFYDQSDQRVCCLYKQPGQRVCCLCEHKPTYNGTDAWYRHSGYCVCYGCNELIKDDPDFFK